MLGKASAGMWKAYAILQHRVVDCSQDFLVDNLMDILVVREARRYQMV